MRWEQWSMVSYTVQCTWSDNLVSLGLGGSNQTNFAVLCLILQQLLVFELHDPNTNHEVTLVKEPNLGSPKEE